LIDENDGRIIRFLNFAIEEIRAEAPAVHAEAILRHLTASK
jgi:hypothetical protein